jgi:hypothetical protein
MAYKTRRNYTKERGSFIKHVFLHTRPVLVRLHIYTNIYHKNPVRQCSYEARNWEILMYLQYDKA